MKISEMRNLGPSSEKSLAKIGIKTAEDLLKIGPEKAFKMMEEKGMKPHLCFLYAMIGAATDKSWNEVVRELRSAGMLKSQQKKKY